MNNGALTRVFFSIESLLYLTRRVEARVMLVMELVTCQDSSILGIPRKLWKPPSAISLDKGYGINLALGKL